MGRHSSEDVEEARQRAVETARQNAELARTAAATHRKLAQTYRAGDGGIGMHDDAVVGELEEALRDEAAALVELADAIRAARD